MKLAADRRVFLYWAVIVGVGFEYTQIRQQPDVNTFWLIVIVLGLAYMKKLMSFKSRQLKLIWWLWAVALIGGLLLTGGICHLKPLQSYIGYLGVIWLVIMGLAHVVNGYIAKTPATYWFSGGLQLATGAIILYLPQLLQFQYVLTAVAGALGMLWLMVAGSSQRVNQATQSVAAPARPRRRM